MRSLLLACAPVFLLLAGCAAGKVEPSPTADQVLAQQYRAGAGGGAMSGPEAQAVTDAYRREIAKPAPATSTSTIENVTER